MRIGIDLQFVIVDQRGMGRVARSVVQQLLVNYHEYQYVLFARNKKEIPLIKDLLGRMGAATAKYDIKPFEQIGGCDLDVCWYPWNRIDNVPGRGFKLLTLHDVAPFVDPFRSVWRYFDQKKAERRYLKAVSLADKIVTVSEFYRREISCYMGIAAAQIGVIHLGVDKKFFRDDHLHRPGDICLGWDGHLGQYILHVGADDKRKNLIGLFTAFWILKRRGFPGLRLVCCGGEDNTPQKYERLLSDHHIKDDVVFIRGGVEEARLLQLYAQAEAFVFPSLYEGFGLPVLEAMAAGVPVVCSAAASLPEVGGDAPAYCDPQSPESIADTISKVLEDERLRQEMVAKGLKRAAQFTWEETAAKYVAAFEELASGHR